MCNLSTKLEHLTVRQREELTALIFKYKSIFSDSPGKTDVVTHDVVLEESVKPIKQNPYRMNPFKKSVVRSEIEYMLANKLISPSVSPWSSPIFRDCKLFA